MNSFKSKTVPLYIITLILSLTNSMLFATNFSDELSEPTTISGTVTDTEGAPAIGANIYIKNNQTQGTITDLNGNFSLDVELPATLVISYLGYSTQEVKLTEANSSLSIILEEGYALGEVLVTARKRVEGIQETPISITAIQGVVLEEMGADDLANIGDIAPNLTFSTTGTVSGSSSAAVVYIRGIGQADYVPVSDPGVGIYVDEVYLGRTIGAVLDLVDLKSVEVIRGPQGTLFGRNTIGGAISLTSNTAGEEFTGRVALTGGSYDRNDLSLSLHAPISEGVGLSFNAVRRNRRGYVERVNIPDDSDEDKWLGNENLHGAKVLLNVSKPDSKFSLKLIGDYVIEREASAAEQNLFFHHDRQLPGLWNTNHPLAPGSTASGYVPGDLTAGTDIYDERQNLGPFKTGETSLSQNDIDAYGFSANLGYDFGNGLSTKLIAAFRGLDAAFSRQVDGSPLNVFENRDLYDQNQLSLDWRINKTSDKFDFVGGAFYFKEDVDNLLGFTGVAEGTLYPVFFGGLVENSSIAAYGEGTFNLSDKFSLTAGLRYTSEEKRARPDAFRDPSADLGNSDDSADNWPEGPDDLRNPDRTLTVVGQDSMGVDILEDVVDNPLRLIDKIWQDNTFSQVTWRLNTAYKASEAVNLYATVSTGFKSGGFEWRVTNPSFYGDSSNDFDGDGDGDLPQFAPETVTSYELGAKIDVPNTDLRFNMAFFYSDYKDMQIAANPPGSIATFQTNAGDATISGLEAEMIWIPKSNVIFNLGYGLTNAKYTDLIEGVSVSEDDNFILTPKHMLTYGLSYKIILGKGSLTPRIDGHYKSRMDFEAQNSDYVFDDGHLAMNASIKYAPNKKLSIIGGVENLTDELYIVGGDANTAIGYENGIYARPRNFYLTLAYNF